MVDTARHDAWQAGLSYEQYMGRWSRQVAPLFVKWLDAPAGAEWLEVGCGTGALTANILSLSDPKSVVAIDPSAGFLQEARGRIEDLRVEFRVGDALNLDVAEQSKDVVVSGLVLNFVPDRAKALVEMRQIKEPATSLPGREVAAPCETPKIPPPCPASRAYLERHCTHNSPAALQVAIIWPHWLAFQQRGMTMTLLQWLRSQLRNFSARPTARDGGSSSQEDRRRADARAQDETRTADARLPPHQGGINY